MGPTTVNSFRLTINRTAIKRSYRGFFSPKDMGINTWSVLPDFMVMSVTGGFSIGGNTQSLATFRTTSYQIADDISLIRGNHQLAFGVNLAHWRVNQRAVNQDTGNFTFNGQETGLGLADFLAGRVSSFSQGSPTLWSTRQHYIGLSAQDTWKATPQLTLNYGLRWEPFLPLRLTEGSVYNFDYDRFRQGIKSTVIANAPAGMYYPGDPGFPKNAAITKQWMNFGPRVGLAWDPQGDGTTSIQPWQQRQLSATRFPDHSDKSGRWFRKSVAGSCERQPISVCIRPENRNVPDIWRVPANERV
jgi:hypothetical protein